MPHLLCGCDGVRPRPLGSPDQKGVYMCACLWSFWTEEGTWAVGADKEGVGVYGCRRWGLHARMKKVGMQTGDGTA